MVPQTPFAFCLEPNIAARLKSDYVVVLIDVNKGRNSEVDAKYGHPTRLGLPVLVVLDASRQTAHDQE